MASAASFTTPLPPPTAPLPQRTLRSRAPPWRCCAPCRSSRVKLPDGGAIATHIYNPDTRPPESCSAVPLFVHDFMTDHSLFASLAAHPSLQTRPLVCPELRGFGSSTPPRRPYSRTDDLHAVLQSLSAARSAPVRRGRAADDSGGGTDDGSEEQDEGDEGERNCTHDDRAHGDFDGENVRPPLRADLVGCGMGGITALEFALARPHLVRSACLLSSGLPGHSWAKAHASFLDVTLPRLAGRLIAMDAALRPAVKTALPAEATEALYWKRAFIERNATWREALEHATPAVKKQLLTMAREYRGFHFFYEDPVRPANFEGVPLIDRLDGVTAPVIVMVGERDTPDFRKIAQEVSQRVPNCVGSVVQVTEAGHFPTLENAQFVGARLAEFWQRCEE